MVDPTLIAVFGTLAGAAITGLISYYNTKIQQKSQDKRNEVSFYIQNRVETTNHLNSILVKTNSIAKKHLLQQKISSREETPERSSDPVLDHEVSLEETLVDLEQAIGEVRIYIPPESTEKLKEYLMIVVSINSYRYVIEESDSEIKEFDIDFESLSDEYDEKYQEAIKIVHRHLASPIREFDNDENT